MRILTILEHMWEVYIIETEQGQFYTGISTDVERRFAEHQNSSKGASFFRRSKPKTIVYREKHLDRSSATRREIEIKRMTRAQKQILIEGN